MQSQVKEFLNNLQVEKEREARPTKGRKYYKGMRPIENHHVVDITEFSNFMECDVSPDICPMIWEELEVDFSDKDKRYCNICDKYVYKANNKFMINKLLKEKQCMSIPTYLLEEINGKIDPERYQNLEDRLVISKLFLVYKNYYDYEWNELQKKGLSYEDQLKYMLYDICSCDYKIKEFIKIDVEIKYIIKLVLHHAKDEDFEKTILDKIVI